MDVAVTSDGLAEKGGHLSGHLVGLFLVVSILGRTPQAEQPQGVLAAVVPVQCFLELLHGDPLFIENEPLHSGEGICSGGQPPRADGAEVVDRSALCHVPGLVQAAVQERGDIRAGELLCIDGILYADSLCNEIHTGNHLPLVSLPELLKGLKIFRVPCVRAHLGTHHPNLAAVEDHLQGSHKGDVVARGTPECVACGGRFHTTDDGIVPGILQGVSAPLERRDHNIIVEQGRARGGGDHVCHLFPISRWRILMDPDGDAVGHVAHVADRVQKQVGQRVHGIVALPVQTSQRHGLVVPPELACRVLCKRGKDQKVVA